jgi:hypothetical protein
MWGPDTPGDSARWGPHMRDAPLIWCATHKTEHVAHILGCAANTYPWSTKTWCAIDNGPMDKSFSSSVDYLWFLKGFEFFNLACELLFVFRYIWGAWHP